jgi:hypothetical protein
VKAELQISAREAGACTYRSEDIKEQNFKNVRCGRDSFLAEIKIICNLVSLSYSLEATGKLAVTLRRLPVLL